MLTTDSASPEMTTCASNVSLVTRITLPNALANLAEAVGAHISDVLKGMGHDRSNTYGPARRQPDISVARSALEWGPVVPFVDGIRRTIAYLQDLRR